ncbi:MAG: hypothetical protein KBC19_03415 [Candidatus Moranbacteria bacterium]|jgi:hypothetical protein|nr:hypothetical protein [Candidatus Moranbacteria bacterium]
MNIVIKKSPVPLIWIDTSVIITLARIKNGEKIDDAVKEKYLYLERKISDLVKQSKLICPKADQYEEIEGGRLEKECRGIQQRLSVGVKLIHRLGIEDHLILLFMEAYIKNADSVTLNYEDIFYENPVEELKENLESRFTVDVHSSKPQDMLNSSKQSKLNVREQWESIRKEKVESGITYEQQLEKEYGAHLNAHIGLAKEYFEKASKGKVDLMASLGISGFMMYIRAWLEYSKEFNIQKFVGFFNSKVFRVIPIIDVRSKLLASLVTSPSIIQSGDSMDSEHLASVIPYFDMVITDKAMKNRVKKLELDKQYGCRVVAMEDFEQIKNYLEKL